MQSKPHKMIIPRLSGCCYLGIKAKSTVGLISWFESSGWQTNSSAQTYILLHSFDGMSVSRVQEYLSTIPVITRVLLLTNISIHVIIFLTSFPIGELAINPIIVIIRGEYYRMVTSVFVHGGLMHIAMNMSTLLAIGTSLERTYGSMKMLFLTLWAIVLSGFFFIALVW